MALITAPDRGINNLVAASLIDDRETPLCKNVLFDQGKIITPYGFSQKAVEGLPLDSNVLKLCFYKDGSGMEYILAVTEDKIYRYDSNTFSWVEVPINDLDDNILLASLVNPISYAAVRHSDAVAIDDGEGNSYFHLLVCDGGLSPIQRWSGRNEMNFYNLKGADGYHGVKDPLVTDHYAKQVLVYYEHVILLSPKTYDATAAIFKENPQGILFGKAGKLEGDDCYKIGETGVGYTDLANTGGVNVWAKLLNKTLIVYQHNSIWSYYWVGGEDVFRANPEISDVGLLGPNLLVGADNVHYFLGSDWNLYAYYGGTVKQRFGDKIRPTLKKEISEFEVSRCYMEIDPINSLLWIFYIPSNSQYMLRAYVVNSKTGEWTRRDFSHKWATGGITTVSLIARHTYFTGKTIQQSIDAGEIIQDEIDAKTTIASVFRETQVADKLTIGDSGGYIYQFDPDELQDDNIPIPSIYHTKIWDLGSPNKFKWWSNFIVNASGTALKVSYRTSHFNTENEGWIELGQLTLTDEVEEYTFHDINITSKQIQFKFSDVDGGSYAIESYDPIDNTTVLDNV